MASNEKDSNQGSSNRGQFDSDTAREAGKKSHSGSGSAGRGDNLGGSSSTRTGSSEQHAEAGRKGGENSHGGRSGGGNQGSDNEPGSTRGGSSEQHAKAGSQSHKNK